MKASAIFIIILAAATNSTSVRGGEFDGSKPIICAVNSVTVCPRTGEIEKDTAEDVNLPGIFFIDVGKKMVTAKGASGETRQTPIETVRHENGALILEGVQLGKAWHAVINEETGKTTITGATPDTAFVVFATSTVNPTSGVREAAGAEKNNKP